MFNEPALQLDNEKSIEFGVFEGILNFGLLYEEKYVYPW